MLTEIKEEIGLTLPPSELKLIFSGRDDNAHVFYNIKKKKKDIDINNLTLQKEEVDYVKWLSKDEMEPMIKQNLFLPSHVMCFHRLLNYLN